MKHRKRAMFICPALFLVATGAGCIDDRAVDRPAPWNPAGDGEPGDGVESDTDTDGGGGTDEPGSETTDAGGSGEDGGTDATTDADPGTYSGTDAGPDTGGDGGIGQLCVDRLNELRRQVGVPELARNAAKESCVYDECVADYESGVPHGTVGMCGEANQSQCGPGSPRPDEEAVLLCIDLFFSEGPGAGLEHAHYEMLVNPMYKSAACAIYTGDGGFWFIVDYFI
jgi:hypothetical protein